MVPEREPHPDLREINNSIETLRQQWIADGLPEEHFWEMYDDIFDRESVRNLPVEENDIPRRRWLFTATLALISIVLAAILNLNYDFVRFIIFRFQYYPATRKLLIPLLFIFPVLSRKYLKGNLKSLSYLNRQTN